MKTLVIKDQMRGEATIDVEKICIVTKPTLKECTDPKGNKSDKFVIEILFTGAKTALFFIDEDEAESMYNRIIASV